MGLAPAPHLGGLAGSPGAIARAEEEARRQRVMNRERTGSSAPPPVQSSHPREEIVEPVPTPFAGTGPPPPPAASPEPAFGTTTLLMIPRTPNIPLTLPRQGEPEPPAGVPTHNGWDAAQPNKDEPSSPGVPSAPTVLVEPPRAVTGPPPPANAASRQPPPPAPQPARHPAHVHAPGAPGYGAGYPDAVEAAPTTQRMLRTMPMATPSVQASEPPAGLVLRRWEPEGAVPTTLPVPQDRRLVLLAEPDSPASDAYRVLRDHLVAKNLPRVVAVSSPQHRDGKTTCAINLALALSEQPSTRVLLVDGNFFEPELARIFQMERLPMLSPPDAEVWLAPYRLAQVTANLHLVAMLRNEMPTGRRFDQHRFEALIDRLCRANYDYIVIDAPALQGTPAVGQLLAVADATLLAVRAGGGTTARELRRAADQIPKDKALGVALIDG